MTTQLPELLDDIELDPTGDVFCVLAENASRIKAESLVPFLEDFFNRVKVSTGFCDADLLRAISLLPQYSSVADLEDVVNTMLLDWMDTQKA